MYGEYLVKRLGEAEGRLAGALDVCHVDGRGSGSHEP